MMPVLDKISPFTNTHRVLVHNQSVGEIMTGILSTHNRYKREYDKICNEFNASTDLQICRKIYDYLKAHTHYVVEPDEKQTLRSPAAILKLGANPKIGLDCKSYSLFIGGILDALNRKGKNIHWCYRFASYKPFDKLPHHVFVVVNPGTTNEIWCDPVIPTFNYHKPYTFKIDKMALIAVSGTDGIGRKSKEQKAAKKATRKQRKNKVKAKIKEKVKKGLKLAVKFNPATVTARNSFLLMVKLNLFGLARNLEKVRQMKGADLKKFWEKIGGKYMSLEGAINVGKNKGHHKKVAGVGFVPAIAGAIAAATPIVLKIVSLLKSCGIDTKQLMEAGKKVVASVANKKLDQLADKEIADQDAMDFSQSDNEFANDGGDMTANNDAGGGGGFFDDAGGDENANAENGGGNFAQNNNDGGDMTVDQEAEFSDDGGSDVAGMLGFLVKKPMMMQRGAKPNINKIIRFANAAHNNKHKRFL